MTQQCCQIMAHTGPNGANRRVIIDPTWCAGQPACVTDSAVVVRAGMGRFPSSYPAWIYGYTAGEPVCPVSWQWADRPYKGCEAAFNSKALLMSVCLVLALRHTLLGAT